MKKRLGDILLSHGMVDTLQLQAALAFQRQWGLPLGQAVVHQGFCPPDQVFAALAEQSGLPSVDLDAQPLDPRLVRLVPLKVAERYRVVPLRLEGPRETSLVVAIAAPASLDALDVVMSVSGKGRVIPRLAKDGAIRRAISRLYHGAVQEAARQEVREAFVLPEADEVMDFMANCMIEDVVIDHTLMEQESLGQVHTLEQNGLPLLSPLELEPEPGLMTARVLVHGWGAEASAGLVRILGEAGLPARVASEAEVLAAGEDTVVVAPLPSMEALGRRLSAQVLVAGHAPEQELKRAQAVGALGILEAPVDPGLLLRAVRRLLRLANESFPRAS
ncbi:MAG: general secretion pathway protein GspE [Myxococcaceae bacterium]|nr:general secretion pathway protein GspE [Myxococcaceae bacterium]